MSMLAVAPTPPRSASDATARRIDLDASANTAPTPAVVAAVAAAMSADHGNPSSNHGRGERSREVLARARDAVTSLLGGAFDDGVVLTSGCTEANNLVLASFARAGLRILTSAVEHPSVLRVAEALAGDRGTSVTILPVAPDGTLNTAALEAELEASTRPALVSIQAANSETGVLQDLPAIARLVRGHEGSVFHSDAAQAIGRIDLTLGDGVGPDLITMSGHKLHGPMGVGAVVTAEDAAFALAPLAHGGEQESGARAGTEAVPLVAGLAEACREWRDDQDARRRRLLTLRMLLEGGLARIGGVTINGAKVPRAPHVASATFHGMDAMSLVARLDARGVSVSQGSACSSRRPEPSHVLRAMGLSETDAFATVRFSLSALNDVDDVAEVSRIVADVVASGRRAV